MGKKPLPKSKPDPLSTPNSVASGETQRQIRVAIWANWITALSCGVALLGLWFVWRTLRATEKAANAAVDQADIAKREYQSSQRPWISVKTEAAQLYIDGKSVQLLGRKSLIKNLGHTVAQDAGHYVSLVPKHLLKKEPCPLPTQQDVDKENPLRLPVGISIFPGQDVTESVFPAFGTLDGQDFLYLVSCLRYRSPIDDALHMTTTVYMVWRPGKLPDTVENPTFGPSDKPQRIDIRLSLAPDGLHAN